MSIIDTSEALEALHGLPAEASTVEEVARIAERHVDAAGLPSAEQTLAALSADRVDGDACDRDWGACARRTLR